MSRPAKRHAARAAKLGARFEGLLERMQTRAAREGMEAAFGAPPEELGRSAVEQAQKRREG